MSFLPENFHFLRPDWLWALLPAIILAALLWNSRFHGVVNSWARHIDPHLLAHLSIKGSGRRRNRLVSPVVFMAVTLVIVGLAGPSWEKSDVPSFAGDEPTVAVLSLAQSMNADDLTPSRLKRSVHKLRDILQRTQGDERGLVIYSDVPFVVTPLTNDPHVIEQMLPELSTSLMPVLGNRLDLAIAKAQQILKQANAVRGRIIVIADNAGSEPKASYAVAEKARKAGYSVSVLAVGTEEGATLQTADGQAISDRDGQTFMTKLSKESLEALANIGGGRFAMITPDYGDLNTLLPEMDKSMYGAGDANDFKADSWIDMGYWLLIIPTLLVPFVFRRGMIMGLAVIGTGILGQAQPAIASTWDDLWATRDQQAQTAFENGDYEVAKGIFENPLWQAGAAYRTGDFGNAVTAYSRSLDPQISYNLGNALAWSSDFKGALQAYDNVLKVDPGDEDAKFNRDIVIKLLEDQEQDQQKQQDQEDQQQGGEEKQQQASESDSQGSNAGDNAEKSEAEQSGGQQADENSSGNQKPEQKNTAQRFNDGAQSEQNRTDSASGEENVDGQLQAGQQDAAPPKMAEQQTSSEPDISEQSHKALQDNSRRSAQGQLEDQQGESALSKLFSEALLGNGEREEEEPTAEAASRMPPIVDQAIEQQLRRVPDDPSGLLRARIHQHYARLRAAQ